MQRTDWRLPEVGVGGTGQMGEGVEARVSSHEIRKSWEVVDSTETPVNETAVRVRKVLSE